MNRQLKRIAGTGIALLLATATFGKVKTDYDRSADFSRYKTYSWERVETKDPLWAPRIKEAVAATLAAKGLTPVDSGGDISILAMEMTQNHRTLNTYYDGFGGGWRWGGGFGDATTTVDNYKVGTLVIDMFDAKTKAIIWRGSSSENLSKDSGKNIKNLDKGVRELFDHFPPGEKR
jgi:hypothetical protein